MKINKEDARVLELAQEFTQDIMKTLSKCIDGLSDDDLDNVHPDIVFLHVIAMTSGRILAFWDYNSKDPKLTREVLDGLTTGYAAIAKKELENED